MADETLLTGLDPFALLGREADRVHDHFAAGPEWSRPSRCAGWTRRDLLSHLRGLEDYVRAGLQGRVRELFRDGAAAGARGVDGINAWLVAKYADLPPDRVLAEWRELQVANLDALRARGRDGSVDTSVGAYSSWLQTLHYAAEYATHGDDVYVEVPDAERGARTAWRVTFGVFVLQELEKPLRVKVGPGAIEVTGDGASAVLSDEDFVEATQGRLPAAHPLDPSLRALLATVP